MQSNGTNPQSPPKPRALRWRELTDEQRWARIYKDRKHKKDAAPKTARDAAALALPCYVLTEAIAYCHANTITAIRSDVHHACLSGVAKLSSVLKPEHRALMADMLSVEYETIRSKGFYINEREFLYAVAAATVKLVDDLRYPADAPATMAALLLKEDAEADDNEWGLQTAHAVKMTGFAYNALIATGFYPEVS